MGTSLFWRLCCVATLVVVCIVFPGASGHTISQQKRESGPTFYHHHARQSSIVLGEYLYIHGGERTTWNGTGSGFGDDDELGDVVTLPSNTTYYTHLTSSWTNESLDLTGFKSEAPSLILQALWEDPSGKSFYAYDGGKSFALQLYDQPVQPPNQLWQFTPSGSGGSGEWSQIQAPASSNFSTLSRGYQGLYASGGGLGFALGGVESPATTTNIQTGDDFLIPGMVMYNFSSQEWYNISATGYSFTGVALNGVAQFVPSFGPAGLLFVLEGLVANGNLPSTDTITMFEPMSQQWSTQAVSGTKPASVTNPCVVGVQGDNNTYEIFLYGGRGTTINDTLAQGVVYVLSLPAFHWQKQNATSDTGRYFHSCNIIGNRQMISIGGRVTDEKEYDLDDATSTVPDSSLPDPWDQGIGVFDMTKMEWKSDYDPNAAPYETPDAVKAYYQKNGRYPIAWTNDVVKDWFTNPGLNKNTTNSTADPSSSSSNSTLSSPSSTRNSNSSGTNKGAIAGGVVGGVAAVALIAALAIFLLRRRGRERSQVPKSESGFKRSELGNNGAAKAYYPASEMAVREAPATELPTRTGGTAPPVYEL